MKRNTWVAGAVLALVLAVPVLARGGSGNSSDTDSERGGGRSENISRGSSGSSSSSGSSRGGSSGSSSSGGGRSGSGSSDSGSRRDGPGRTGSERGGGSKSDKSGSGTSDADKGGSEQGGSGTDTSRRNGPTDRGRDDTDLRPHRRLERDHGERRDRRGDRFFYPGYGLFGYDSYYGGLENRDNDDRPFKGGDNVEIRVKPDNAQVYVNGLLYSNKGKAKFGLPSGPWKIELRAPGYLTQIIELNVEQGIRYTIERKLEKDLEQGPDRKPLKTEELNRTE